MPNITLTLTADQAQALANMADSGCDERLRYLREDAPEFMDQDDIDANRAEAQLATEALVALLAAIRA